jgi:hypothetical protein
MPDIKLIQMLMDGELPPVNVRLETKNIIEIMAAVVITWVLIMMINSMFKK